MAHCDGKLLAGRECLHMKLFSTAVGQHDRNL